MQKSWEDGLKPAIDAVADTIGSETGNKTIILLGHDFLETEEIVHKTKEELYTAKERADHLYNSLSELKKNQAIAGTLSANAEKLIEKLGIHLNNAETILEE